ncbi:MAG: DNA/RNA non-specific endonuclease [Bacteroidales bacterium]|nr:DNA/RNA non-specific endonuclease [Bacteroidales bacterium]
MEKKSQLVLVGVVLLALALWLVFRQHPSASPNPLVTEIDTTSLLELPAEKAGDHIIEYRGFVSSYNTETLIPNWVAYELTSDETSGDATRADKNFSMDLSFRGRQAKREDYARSGWTKGHMAPAADFFWDDDAMAETFFFQNICPQREELNNKDWQYLEKQVRNWANRYGKVWVVSGPIIGDNIYGTIGEDHVVVPDAFFKAVLVHDGRRYQSIAFVMGNDAERYWLQDCALSIDELEERTGLDLYPALPDDLEDDTESRYDFSVWGIRRR